MALTRCRLLDFPTWGFQGQPTDQGVIDGRIGCATPRDRAWSFRLQCAEHFIVDQEVFGARLGQTRL